MAKFTVNTLEKSQLANGLNEKMQHKLQMEIKKPAGNAMRANTSWEVQSSAYRKGG
ncbi:hypothetical protein GCM10027343_26320 [Noviherbaspirillum agri]